ncbi:polar amino acid ABC transporter permease [Desulfuromonas versatilis]|uniref:Polar amino acid ABC transporter permease n=1 Tax=Desulfuromonas versatilis TaxID=2802975 RepID=A0ABN6E3Q0_9BACT|nr:amino acid ABC transporter permease [Desulfuromonas versatilis]BCR06794.1 polar amino acid ABC transporter permease [Desulfuromonas versatilis]
MLPRPPSKAGQWLGVAKFILLVLALAWLVLQGAGAQGYHWQWYRIPRYLFSFSEAGFVPGPLLQGVVVTLRIVGASLVVALAVGLLVALMRLSGSLVAPALARLYLELVRNTPLLIQIFFIYFVLAPMLGIGRFASAVLALGLFEGAYASEIIRAGIVSVPRGQWEAAYSSGLGLWATYRRVVLPQAVRRVVPPLTSQAVSLVKDSALVSTIAIYDLTMQGQVIVAETFLTFETWFTVAAIYLVITVSLSAVVKFLEGRLAIPG